AAVAVPDANRMDRFLRLDTPNAMTSSLRPRISELVSRRAEAVGRKGDAVFRFTQHPNLFVLPCCMTPATAKEEQPGSSTVVQNDRDPPPRDREHEQKRIARAERSADGRRSGAKTPCPGRNAREDQRKLISCVAAFERNRFLSAFSRIAARS